MFTALVAFAIFPTAHVMIEHGPTGHENVNLNSGFGLMLLLYGFGVLIYAKKWPESQW